ncbi:MAG: VOC family protein [Flavobacteriaceae bacterium]
MENKSFNPVGWFEIYVNDIQRAQKFYEHMLQITMQDLPTPEGDAAFKMVSFPSDMNVYGSGGTIVKMEGFPAGGNSTLVYFSCEDCAVEESRIEAAGGKIFRPKMSICDYGFITLGFDSEGNMFGLHSLQ